MTVPCLYECLTDNIRSVLVLPRRVQDLPPRHVGNPEPELRHLAQALELAALPALGRLEALAEQQVEGPRLRVEGFAVGRGRVVFHDLWKLFFLSALAGHQEEVGGGAVEPLVALQLQLEAKVGADLRPFALEELQRLQEGHALVLDEEGDDERGGLYRGLGTLEMPAPQCTKMPPVLRSTSEGWYVGRSVRRLRRSAPRCSRSSCPRGRI